MQAIRTFIVTALLGVWFFPAAGSATPLSNVAGEVDSRPAAAASNAAPAPSGSVDPEARALAAREKQSPALQDFKGGGVYVYLGSGALVAILIVLLIFAL